MENKIKENLAYFYDNEPDDGHEARFASKLNKRLVSKPKKYNLSVIIKIAAALLLLVTTSYLIMETVNNTDLQDEMYVSQIVYSQELNKVQSYYDELTIVRLNRIYELAPSEEEAEKLKIKALKRMDKLDANLAKIEKEYVKNPQCEKLKAAIVNNKKMKVEVVNNIVEQLDNAQQGYHAGSMFTNF
ncbi:MAG: hypothetical protein QM503_11405 [Bacteroidota bacterium]